MRLKKMFSLALTVLAATVMAVPAFAADAAEAAAASGGVSGKALACGIAIGLASAGGALAMGMASGKATEGIARQPESNGDIRSTLMLSLVFIETAVIYALLTVILVIFVL